MSGDNFIYFGAVSGFFIGIIFGIIKEFSIFDFLAVVVFMSAIGYILGLIGVSFYIKYIDLRKIVFFNKKEIDEILETQIKELEKKENFILESYEFIKQIEQEELNLIKSSKKATK